MSPKKIRLGISTCPNDTFAFHALLHHLVDWHGLEFEVDLLDIQQLNDRLFRGEFDVAKASFHAALLLADRTCVLPSGAALGFGVGPLLLSSEADLRPSSSAQLTLCPGEHTTATLLFSLFYPQTTRVRQIVFSDIMPQLMAHQANFGVCIHEGRFTWQQQGLFLVEDLGTRWERETQCPLPLGGILANRSLPRETLWRVQETIHASLQFALNDPLAPLPTMQQYAQELDPQVVQQHVDLYVNQWTVDLGEQGANALAQLSQRAKQAGLLAPGGCEIEVLQHT